MRAVAERAGVNERTVYRHFTNERGLRDAVMHRLEEQAGIDLDDAAPRGHRRRRGAHLRQRVRAPAPAPPAARPDPHRGEPAPAGGAAPRAGAARPEGWTDADRTVAAAMFDVLWGVAPYERLVADWQLDPDQAVAGITWVIGLIEDGRARRTRTPPASGTQLV